MNRKHQWIVCIVVIAMIGIIALTAYSQTEKEQYEAIYDLISSGKSEEAVKRCNDLLRRDNRDVNAWNIKGVALLSLNKPGDAVNCFNQALAIVPNAAGLWINKGNALVELQNYAEALKSYDEAIAFDPDQADVWSQKGQCLNALGQYTEAIDSFDRALELEPDDARIFARKIHILEMFVQKANLIERAKLLARKMDTPAGYFNKGYVQLLLQLDKEAAQNFQQFPAQRLNIFLMAVKTGQLKLVDFWLEQGLIDVEAANDDGQIALHLAAMHDQSEMTTRLLDRDADIHATDNDGWDALMYAAHTGSTETAKILIERGAEVNQRGYTPLMAAARQGHVETVRLLLQSGADKQAQITHEESEYNGWTALQFAEAENHQNVVQLFEEAVQVQSQSRDSKSSAKSSDINADLFEAVKNNDIEAARIALQAGADPDRNSGTTALIVAAQKGSVQIVKLLLEYHADVNASAGKGFTALMNAAYYGHAEVVKLLLEYDADVYAETDDGRTAVDLAERKGHTEIVHLFEQPVQMATAQQPTPITEAKHRYDLNKDIGEALAQKFVAAEFFTLWDDLQDEGFPDEGIQELSNSEEFMEFVSLALVELLEAWGPDIWLIFPMKKCRRLCSRGWKVFELQSKQRL